MSGSVPYYNGSSLVTGTAGTAGQVFVSQGTGAPAWQNAGLQIYAISSLVSTSPYVVGTEYFIPVDTSTTATTLS